MSTNFQTSKASMALIAVGIESAMTARSITLMWGQQ